MKLSLQLLCWLLLPLYMQAQASATIEGKITDLEGGAVPYINVFIEGTNWGSASDDLGLYRIGPVKPGNYTLKVQGVGIKSQSRSIQLEDGQTLELNFTILDDVSQLEEVVVSPLYTFAKKETEYVARMPLKNLENPQVYSVIPNRVMKEQVAVDVRDAMRNSPGVLPVFFPSGGIAVISRGFLTGINARNGLQSTTERSSLDLVNVERIEVLKGPSGTLFGAEISSFGGVVNIVTKKPHEQFSGNITYIAGNRQFNRITADVNIPLNEEKTMLFRINTAWHQENSFMDYGYNNTFTIAPSFLYKVSDRLMLKMDVEFYKVDQTRGISTRWREETGFSSMKDIPLAFDRSLYNDDANAEYYTSKSFVEANYQLSDKWVSTTAFSFINEKSGDAYQYYPTWISPTEVVRGVALTGPNTVQSTNIQQNFVGEFTTGSLDHKFLIGANSTSLYTKGQSRLNPAVDTVNITGPFEALTKWQADAAMAGPNGYYNEWGNYQRNEASAYVSDVIGITDKLSTMLSLRYSYFDQTESNYSVKYNQSSLSPKLGLVYQVVKDRVSLFANYMNGYENVEPYQQPDGTPFTPNPVYANQTEAGVKIDLADHIVNATFSYFNIDIDNAIREDSDGVSHQDSRQVSKGIEAEVIITPFRGLNGLFSYLYNTNKYGKGSDVAGNQAENAPENVFNCWLSYKFQNEALNGFGLGMGGSYTDEFYRDSDNTYGIPSYTLLNTALFYETGKWNLAIKVNNLTNEKTWDVWGNPQPLRQVLGSVSLSF